MRAITNLISLNPYHNLLELLGHARVLLLLDSYQWSDSVLFVLCFICQTKTELEARIWGFWETTRPLPNAALIFFIFWTCRFASFHFHHLSGVLVHFSRRLSCTWRKCPVGNNVVSPWHFTTKQNGTCDAFPCCKRWISLSPAQADSIDANLINVDFGPEYKHFNLSCLLFVIIIS
jgi:hypothetical protein